MKELDLNLEILPLQFTESGAANRRPDGILRWETARDSMIRTLERKIEEMQKMKIFKGQDASATATYVGIIF